MALIYQKKYNHTAKVGDKEYKFTPWTTLDEKNYLLAVESEETITDTLLFDLLIRPCLEDDDVILSSDEQKMLMIEIRKKSLGTSFPMRYSCKKCKQVNDIDVEFDQIIKYSSPSYHDVEVQDMKFMFGEIASENLKSRLDDQNTNVDYAFTEVLLHIQSIEINGNIEDTFTYDELVQFMEDIPSSIFDKVFEEFQSMKGSLDFELKTFCMVCNTENNVEFDHIPNFLWT